MTVVPEAGHRSVAARDTLVRLEPMTPTEFGEYLARAIPRRAERMVARGVWTPERAEEASRAGYDRALPQGLATPDQHLCHIVRESDGARVGEVWFSAKDEGGQLQCWVEWIYIAPEHRRRGYAEATLVRLESEVIRRGGRRLGLDVWEDNPGAFALYRKLGYEPVRATLVKSLDPAQDGR